MTVEIERVEPLSRGWAKLDRYTLRYRRRDGREDRLIREVHDHGHGAAVLPYDPARGTVLLVRQFRLPAHLTGQDGFLIEACAGLLDGNDPETCARREAEEELGVRISRLRPQGAVFLSPGAVTEQVQLFLADYDLAAFTGAGGGHAHEGEDIEVLEMPFADMREMMTDGRILDAKTLLLGHCLAAELSRAA
ncbi:MAG: NUDIX domain-containing protein [Aestuariivirga sp.]|uniref:NUDIX domain-containing protein n=1 Tax=Aestuariivirga sp. TaxID=2650926 RepID=UPI0038D069B0